ncbi:MAG: hypothetical protein A2Z34_03605 [Planctomycetes bacterium RBG_16_59_8]|nr:MAG: hypothetical protein A2Z34_03605 [Planctomycetes bacterium RBG_16_59_8]
MATFKLNHMIFCDHVCETSGKVNMLGIFTTIWARQFPCQHPQFFIAISLSGQPNEHTFRLQFRDTSGNFILPPTPELKFRCPEFGEANVNVRIDGLRIQKPGFVAVEVFVDGEKLGEKDLIANQTS